jgi:V8-like Glu-specific endopeptidase
MNRVGIAAVLLAGVCLGTAGAAAQSFSDAQEFELDQTKKELERIRAENRGEAPNAQKTLETLNDPGRLGTQMRNGIRERSGRRIVNGVPATGFPAVGALLLGRNPASAKLVCTGTLVGCDKFLTAAHCIFNHDRPESYQVFLQELGFFPLKAIRWPKNEYRQGYASYDLAMLTLARSADGIAPMLINLSTNAKPLNKTIATIVGFGRTGGERRDFGIRRIGSARIGPCTSQYADKAICWNYDAAVKAGSSRSNTCNGDSGGGVLMLDHDGQRRVHKIFGVVSGGTDAARCMKNDESYNVDVAEFAAWIEQAGEGRLSSQQCGSYRAESVSKSAKISITASNQQVDLPLDVPADLQRLRIAMNAEYDGRGSNDFNLLVYRGWPRANNAQPMRAETGPGQFAFCDIPLPEAGHWSVVVESKQGKGDAQITATFVRTGVR